MFQKIKINLIVASVILGFSTASLAYEKEDFVIMKQKSEDEVLEKNELQKISGLEQIASVAKSLLGTKYKFGGVNPITGFDCSGFVSYVFKEGADIKLPRGSRDMRTLGRSVDLKSLKPGDLLFFKLNSSHVAIYIGENRFIHAPSTGRSVAIDSILDGSFASKITGARRLVELD
jgi:cell wall-associated NlpC family hydrolase